MPAIFEPWARVLADFVGINQGDVVLDVATGPGTVARLAAARVGVSGHVVGVDVSKPMLDAARSKVQFAGMAAIEYVECPTTELLVQDAAFDVVLCQQGLQFFPDRQLALSKMRRTLKPGGRLGVAVWGERPPNFAKTEEALVELGMEIPEATPFGLRPGELAQSMEEAGFEVRRAEDVTLTVTYEGGLDEILKHIPATPRGPAFAALPTQKHTEFRRLLGEKLRPWTEDRAIRTPMMARLALGVKPA